MTHLKDLAIVCRSKNAGPFKLTLDVVLPDPGTFQRMLRSGVLSAARIAALYGVRAEDVLVTPYAPANAIKATLPRQTGAGDLGDSDVYGAQQHAPLLSLDIPD